MSNVKTVENFIKRLVRRMKNLCHGVEAYLAAMYYGFPSKKIQVIGVTGTDGKTTTTHLIYHILKEQRKKVSMISTVYAKVGESEYDTGLHTTTPSSFLVEKLIKKAVDHGDEYFVLETTSHALDQKRGGGVWYAVSVITNITHEHLDYHKTYDNYVSTKAKIFNRSSIGIINADDQSYPFMLKYIVRHNKHYASFGLKKKATYMIDFRKKLGLPLTEFNASNYLAAYAVSKQLGLNSKQVEKALLNFVLPIGRLDLIYNKTFSAMVDFAHTPNAIQHVLESIRLLYIKNDGSLIHVFGAAGLRDFTKRPIMGEESAQYADIIILTEEDYRTEDLLKICQEIAKGIEKRGFKYIEPSALKPHMRKIYTIIPFRDEAIHKAISLAEPHDFIVATGKGHEKSLCREKKEYPWDDREALKKWLIYYNYL